MTGLSEKSPVADEHTLGAHAAPADWMARAERARPPMTDEQRIALWMAARTPDPCG